MAKTWCRKLPIPPGAIVSFISKLEKKRLSSRGKYVRHGPCNICGRSVFYVPTYTRDRDETHISLGDYVVEWKREYTPMIGIGLG